MRHGHSEDGFLKTPAEAESRRRETDMTPAMILDIVVILLLVPTIIYAVILNRKLAARLRRSREELSKVVNSFNEATMRAEAGIPKLKKAPPAIRN